jgi:hypothetical protein
MNSNSPNLSKSGPSKVREIEVGKLRKRTIFENEGDTLVIINNTKDEKFAESSDASKDSNTLANNSV